MLNDLLIFFKLISCYLYDLLIYDLGVWKVLSCGLISLLICEWGIGWIVRCNYKNPNV